MLRAVFLYGSRARNEGDDESDTDILGIKDGGKIERSFDDRGISFHCYPLEWLLRNSAEGSLFLLHLAQEAIVLFDPEDCLVEIRRRFQYKTSYTREIEVGLRILRAVEALPSSDFNHCIRARYFWGLRTAIIAATAVERHPSFSSIALEQFSRIEGLALHIRRRREASLEICQTMARRVLAELSSYAPSVPLCGFEENLRALSELGGVGAVTAGEMIYGA